MSQVFHTLAPRLPDELYRAFFVALGFVFVSVLFPRVTPRVLRAVEAPFSRFAERRTLAIVVLFGGIIVVRLALLHPLPVPVPGIHDEYSYLLLGDTLAHGRLANPTHPLWMSFESFHINWFPTYSSKYPPGQGAALALGELLGHPWAGVVLSVAVMCAAILWMLQGWLRPRWALLGALWAALQFGITSYWMNSYWGGAVAATGGALVLGAMPRLVCRGQTRDALLLGLGLAIVANTRPYEGLLFSLPVLAWFLWWLAGGAHSSPAWRARALRVLLPLSAILAATLAFMGFYNWRLTRDPLLFPYVLNSRIYQSASLFLWERSRPPLHYDNRQFEDFYNGWERDEYKNTWHDVWRVSVEKLTRGGHTFFWWGAVLLLPGAALAFFQRKMRIPLLIFLLSVAGFFSSIWSMPHYLAPATGVISLLMVQAIRQLRRMRFPSLPMGTVLSWAAMALLAIDVTMRVSHHTCDPLKWTCQGDPSRAVIAEKLAHTPGKHLILVRYDEDHNLHDEWVYNGAEIDSAKVLWARELDPQQNAKLFAYFKDRQFWLVEPDTDNTELIRYAPPPSSTVR